MTILSFVKTIIAPAAFFAFVSSMLTVDAQAEATRLRMAYLLTDSMLPIIMAQKEGSYAAAGVDLDLIEVQGGPAVVAAIASGDADIGYASPVPPINARLKGIKVKMFLAMGHEVDPDSKFVWLLASKASGIRSMADVKGKTITFNSSGGLCELAWRQHLATVGMTINDVKAAALPFPDTEAALEQGTIDATCTINPFYSSILANPKIGAVEIAKGFLPNEAEPVISDVIFGTDSMLDGKPDAIKAFVRVTDEARKSLLADRAKMEGAAMTYLGLTQQSARTFNLPVVRSDMTITDKDVQRILDAMHETGMLPEAADAKGFVKTMAD